MGEKREEKRLREPVGTKEKESGVRKERGCGAGGARRGVAL